MVGVGVLERVQPAVASVPENCAPSVAENAAFAGEAKTNASSREATITPPARRIRCFRGRNKFGALLCRLPFYGLLAR